MVRTVTLQTIADRLGISKATVSYALRDDPKITETVRKRVKEEAANLGYRPDPALSRLAAYRWPDQPRAETGTTVVYLSSFNKPDPPGERVLMETIKAEIERLGYEFSILRVNEYKTVSGLLRVLKNRGVAGIIVGTVRKLDCEVIRNMDWSVFPAVACGGGYYNPPIPTFTFHVHQSVMLAWQKAVEYGYKRIALALYAEPTPSEDDILRYGAAQWVIDSVAEKENRIAPWVGSIYEPEKAIPWLKKNKPDAVISYHIGLQQMYMDLGAISETTGFAVFHMEEETNPIYSGAVRENHRRARLLGKQLDLYIRHHIRPSDGPPMTSLLQMAWQEGTTLPRRQQTND